MGKIKVGSVIGGRYEARNILSGGMGDVFICTDKERNENIVLKTLQDRLLKSKFMVNTFKHEALAWIILDNHPNIVRAKYVIKLDKKPYIALEYIPPDEKGRNILEHFFKEKLELKQILDWSLQLCHGMEYAISKGVVSHLDIKPSNLMIDKDKVLKLCDFGLAKIATQEEIDSEQEELKEWKILTEKYRPDLSFIGIFEGRLVTGSEKWMAPERFKGLGDVRSDIFSFGVVMYQMVNKGSLPFSEQSLKPYVLSIKNQPEIIVKELYPIIEKCLQTNPDDRYQSFQQIREDLSDLYELNYGKVPLPPEVNPELEAWEFENKGISYITLGLTDMATRELWKAIQLRPNQAETHNYLGLAYKEKGALEVALVSFSDALKINPNLYEVHCNLGDTHFQIGNADHAKKEYLNAIKCDETYFDAQYKLAKAYEKLEENQEAIDHYENILNNVITKDNRYFKKISKKIKDLKKVLKKKG